jgi:hypothetical protein
METSAWKIKLEAALQVDYFARLAWFSTDFEQVRSISNVDGKSNFLPLIQDS